MLKREWPEAFEVIARQTSRIQLVVSDMVMPKMGGAALAERLKTSFRKSRWFLSGYAEYSGASWYGEADGCPAEAVFPRGTVEKVRKRWRQAPRKLGAKQPVVI